MSLAMKKIVTVIAAVLYIITSTGAMVHLHYCMGKQANWRLGYSQSKICEGCGMEEGDNVDGGCKDQHKYLKNDNDQKAAENSYQFFRVKAISILPGFIIPALLPIASVTEENSFEDAPPRRGGLAVYIFNRVLLI